MRRSWLDISKCSKTNHWCPQVPGRPLPTIAEGLIENSWCLLNVLCLFNYSFPGSYWCGIHSVSDFSEAQPQGEVTLHQRDMPEGAWAFSEPRLWSLQTPAPPKADGPSYRLGGEGKKERKKENRAKEEDKGMFQDSKRSQRELIPLIRSCV